MANVFDSWVNQKRRCIVAYGYLRESACVCGFRSKIPEILIAGFALGWGFFFSKVFRALHSKSGEHLEGMEKCKGVWIPVYQGIGVYMATSHQLGYKFSIEKNYSKSIFKNQFETRQRKLFYSNSFNFFYLSIFSQDSFIFSPENGINFCKF